MHSTPKFGLMALLAAIIATTPLAIDMYLPAMALIADDLHTNISHVQQSLSIFLAAFALGMLLFGPLADALGRRKLALFGLAGSGLASLLLAFTQDIEIFLSLRALQAFCGAAASVVVPSIIRHLYQEHTAKGMSYVSMMMMLAPLLAPSIGSLLLYISHWQSIFAVLSGYAIIIFILSWKYLPEISTEKIPVNFGHFFTSYSRLLTNKLTQPLILSMAFSSFAFFCFVTAAPFIYLKYFAVNEQIFSAAFGFNVIALIMANYVNSRWVTKFGSINMLRMALALGLGSAALLVIGTYYHWGLSFTLFAIAFIMSSISIISTNTDALIIMGVPKSAGTATAVTGTLRFGCGALAGPVLALCFNHTLMPFALLMLGGLVGVMASQYLYWRLSRPIQC